MAEFTREDKIGTVMKSPEAVADKDRTAWISIFARYNVVEDPVGSRPHHNGVYDPKSGRRGNGALERFFDTFIAPNEIIFHVDRDIVCEDHVVRDLTIEISMSPAVTVHVPMHLLYELVEENGELRIARLAAHWELWPMIKQLIGLGRTAWPVLWNLGVRMMKLQGISGALGFSRGFMGIGQRGKELVYKFVDGVNTRNPVQIFDIFDALNAGVEFPHGESPMHADDLARQEELKISVFKILAAGYTATATCEVQQGNRTHLGVAIFEFCRRSKRIDKVTFYWDD